MATARVTITKSGRNDTYGLPLVVGTTYTLDYDYARALFNQGFATDADEVFTAGEKAPVFGYGAHGKTVAALKNSDGTESSLQVTDEMAGNKFSEDRLARAKAGDGMQKLLLIGDSLNARMGNAFAALGGWSATVTAIAQGAGATANLTFSATHGIPAGQQVRFSSDALVQSSLRNRWFNFTSTGAATGTISVPADAYDFAYLTYTLSNIAAFTGSAELSIDAIRGFAGSYFQTLFNAFDPFDEVVNLCIPGARSGELLYTDTLAFIKTIDLTQFTNVGITVGINDMAQALDPAITLSNIIEISERCLDAGCFVCIDEVYPQGSMTAAAQIFLQTVNPGLSAYASNRTNVVVNATREIINDPTTDLGSATDLSDGTHLNAVGAVKIGAQRAMAWGKALNRRIHEAFSINTPPSGSKNYLTNPAMTGTGGTVTGPSTGVCATGWTIAAPGTNVTCVGRKHARLALQWRYSTAYALGYVVKPTAANGLYYVCTTAGTSGASAPTWGAVAWATTTDNTATWTAFPSALFEHDKSRGDWQYVQGSVGGAATAQERITLTQTVTLASVGLAAGDWIRGKMRVRVVDSNFAFYMLSIRSGSTINGMFSFCASGGKNSLLTATAQPSNTADGLMVTDWYKIPAGQTTLSFYLEAGCSTGYENSVMRFFATDAVLEKRTW